MKNSGTLFDIQRFSLVDGPGIRTTVFLKGCPLRCKWCHNPESQCRHPNSFTLQQLCQCGGEYVRVEAPSETPRWEELGRIVGQCTECKCIHHLDAKQLARYIGWTASVDEVLEVILADADYYQNSEGGLTLSGGEPMEQFEYTLNLARGATEAGVHVCLDTSGAASLEQFEAILAFVNLFHLDWKLSNPTQSKYRTGVNGKQALKTLALLDQRKATIRLRCPLIPEVNDAASNFAELGELMVRYQSIECIELLPYHTHGSYKYKALGLVPYQFREPNERDLERWNTLAERYLDISRSRICGSL